jgi:KDO2-lipid IV(A) lauroyltransferase
LGKFWWGAEVALARFAIGLSRAMPARCASSMGGTVTRWIGPLLPASRIARRNLALAFPAMPKAERRRVLRQAWDNLGRTALELPHVQDLLQTASGPGWELEGAHHLPQGGRAILVSAHLANWELLPKAAVVAGLSMAGLYRAANNPGVDLLMREVRGSGASQHLFPKGARGTRLALKHLASGGTLGLLADQKFNEGVSLPFFGEPAMTTTAPAELALRFGCPLIPVRVLRIGPCRFRIIVEPPLTVESSGVPAEDAINLTRQMNGRIEAWIRERPGEWLWMHRRLPKSFYRTAGPG